ncbi:MAG: magnesium transporter [Bacteroidetes bacterium]|nr:magnesium transporter [Bacteroidota bacterium]
MAEKDLQTPPDANPELNSDDQLIIDQGLIEDIQDMLTDKDDGSLLNILLDLHTSEIADILNHLTPDESVYLFKLLNDELAGEVLLELSDNSRSLILDSLGEQEITSIIDEMDSDDAADVIQELDEEVAEAVLESIDEEDSREVKELLQYEEDTAGGLMAREFISIHETSSIYDAIMEVKKQAEEIEDVYDLYVTDDAGVLVGTLDLKSLIIKPSYKKVSEVMDTDFISVPVSMDQEEVARIMQKHDLVAVAVLNQNEVLVGQITIDDIVDVIREEAEEDIQRLTGVVEEDFSDKTLRIVMARLPWLLIGLFGEMISGMVIRGFEATLAQMVVLYAYIPLIMAMGGSTGVQTTSIMIQGLAKGELWLSDVGKRLMKEIGVAGLISLSCGIILFITSLIGGGTLKMALTIAGALIFVMMNASVMGTVFPIFLKKLNIDPAVASGPFITTLNDILGLTIYFTIAWLVFFS